MIAPLWAQKITLNFTEFQFQRWSISVNVFQCTDLICNGQELIAELAGRYANLPVVTSNTGIIKVTYTSVSDEGPKGFAANWSSVSNPISFLTQASYQNKNLECSEVILCGERNCLLMQTCCYAQKLSSLPILLNCLFTVVSYSKW
jgi:hypothetical protein